MRLPGGPAGLSEWRGIESIQSEIPTMLTPTELAYCRWLGESGWDGTGHVVEVGPWLGGSTYQLAAGMSGNTSRHAEAKLHVVDNFRWRPFMEARAPLGLRADDSFRSYFEENMAQYRELLAVHEVNLPDDDSAELAEKTGTRTSASDIPPLRLGDIDGTVSVLFIDGAKSWAAVWSLLECVGPNMESGNGVIVWQDFQYWLAFWVPMAVGSLLESGIVELVDVLDANTVSCDLVSPIPNPSEHELPERLDEIDRTEGLRLLAVAEESLLDVGERHAAAITALAQVSFLGTLGDWAGATEAFRKAEARWPLSGRNAGQLTAARLWLETHGESSIQPSLRSRFALGAARVTAGMARRFPRR